MKQVRESIAEIIEDTFRYGRTGAESAYDILAIKVEGWFVEAYNNKLDIHESWPATIAEIIEGKARKV